MGHAKLVAEGRIGSRQGCDFGVTKPKAARGTPSPSPASTRLAISGRRNIASRATIYWCLSKVADQARSRIFHLQQEEQPEPSQS